MYFVPIVPSSGTGAPVTPRTRELADLLGRVIEEYEKHHPAVSGSEVRQAMDLALQRSQKGGADVARLALAAGLGGLAVAGVLAYLVMGGGVSSEAAPMAYVAIGIFAVLVTLILAKKAGR